MTVREASIRKATVADLQNLVLLENACFTSDRLTSRRFRHFIKNEQSELWLSTSNTTGSDQVNAYALMLFHRGTSLARLYSIAVSPDCRGQGLAQALLEKVEERAIKHGVMFIRLEVKQDNERALDIYQLAGYQKLRVLREYYEDGADGWRLEKRLRPSVSSPQNLPFYAQTTPFTCGPSALLMALKSLQPERSMLQIDELDIWREATTIYLTTGHGGCSPQGLALAALNRQCSVQLWLSDRAVPFLEGVRNAHKREVLALVSNTFQQRCDEQGIDTLVMPLQLAMLREALAEGKRILLLISTYRLNRNKAPHWVWLVAMDDDFAYINDPDVDEDQTQVDTDNIYVPVGLEQLAAMIQYGRRRYTAAVVLS